MGAFYLFYRSGKSFLFGSVYWESDKMRSIPFTVAVFLKALKGTALYANVKILSLTPSAKPKS